MQNAISAIKAFFMFRLFQVLEHNYQSYSITLFKSSLFY